MLAKSAPSQKIKKDKTAHYIVGARYDWAFFILAPLWALGLGLLLGWTPLGTPRYPLFGRSESTLSIFSGIFTASHLFIVFFRSHGNATIFKTYPKRFVWVPLILFSAMMLSSWVLIAAFVISVWWDVYHSGLQTFGLGRIYDSKYNADCQTGRMLDYGLNLVLYAAPIFAGVSFADHVVHFQEFYGVGSPKLGALAELLMAQRPVWAWLAAGITVPYLFYYLWAYRNLSKRGYVISRQKIALLVSTALCSVWAWGFNPFGQAFFIMNFFHSLQYFALVAHTEQSSLEKRLGLSGFEWKKLAICLLIVITAAAYGVWAEFCGESNHTAFSLLITVSLLHFWYDGFIWSVRKRQI